MGNPITLGMIGKTEPSKARQGSQTCPFRPLESF